MSFLSTPPDSLIYLISAGSLTSVASLTPCSPAPLLSCLPRLPRLPRLSKISPLFSPKSAPPRLHPGFVATTSSAVLGQVLVAPQPPRSRR
ncbi:MAG: hypothetical protein WCI46_10815 [Verrucomicrobiota bacterium]